MDKKDNSVADRLEEEEEASVTSTVTDDILSDIQPIKLEGEVLATIEPTQQLIGSTVDTDVPSSPQATPIGTTCDKNVSNPSDQHDMYSFMVGSIETKISGSPDMVATSDGPHLVATSDGPHLVATIYPPVCPDDVDTQFFDQHTTIEVIPNRTPPDACSVENLNMLMI